MHCSSATCVLLTCAFTLCRSLAAFKMASYGYGFGSSQSQGYSNVHPQSSYTAQASSAYGGSYGGTAAAAPRQMVPQSYDANAGYGYGYGRQQDTQSSSIPSSHQSTYGSSSYMSRDAGGYDASKSSYGYGSSSQGIPIYAFPNFSPCQLAAVKINHAGQTISDW